MSTEQLAEAVRAVLDAAHAWYPAAQGRYVTLGENLDPVDIALIKAMQHLEALLAPPPWNVEERVPVIRVVAGDHIQLKGGTWVPVLERWTRLRGIEIAVELPPADPNDPDSAPTRRTYLMQPSREVTRRPGEDTAAVNLLTEAVGAVVITSKGGIW